MTQNGTLSADPTACYLNLDEAQTRWLTLWLIVDLDSSKGRQIVLNSIKFLKKSKDARISIMHNGKQDSKTAKIIKFFISHFSNDQATLIIQKAIQDEKWLRKLETEVSVLKEFVTKVSPSLSSL